MRSELDAVVRALLAKDPNERPAKAAEVARTLSRIAPRLPEVRALPWVLGPSDPSAPTLELAAEPSAGSGSSATAWQVTGNAAADRELEQMLSASRRGRRARLAIGALVVVAIAAVAIPVAWRVARQPTPSRLELPIELSRRPNGAQLVAGAGPAAIDPTAPSLVTRPGGDAQTDYEAERRKLEDDLATRGLRLRDLRHHPELRGDFHAQDRAAREGDYVAAASALASLRQGAAATSNESLLDARLRAVEARVGPAEGARAAAVRALRLSLADASRDRAATRTFQRRLDGIDDGGER
jgi:hypothetical protein